MVLQCKLVSDWRAQKQEISTALWAHVAEEKYWFLLLCGWCTEISTETTCVGSEMVRSPDDDMTLMSMTGSQGQSQVQEDGDSEKKEHEG